MVHELAAALKIFEGRCAVTLLKLVGKAIRTFQKKGCKVRDEGRVEQ